MKLASSGGWQKKGRDVGWGSERSHFHGAVVEGVSEICACSLEREDPYSLKLGCTSEHS